MTPSVWLAPKAPDLIWFRGSDAVRFLNDLITQEIGDMTAGEVRRSLLLGPDGKMDHILWVVRDEDGVGLITEPGRGKDLETTLRRYRIRVDVEIEPEEGPVWLVMGPWEGIDISWGEVRRSLVLGERPDLATGSDEDYQAARIAAGEPSFGADVDATTIPQETTLVPASVDFTKGCFLGQELVGRIEARGGNAPRRLRFLELDGEASAGTVTTIEGNEVGRLTSVAGSSGLGVLKRRVEPGEVVQVGSATATVREIPPNPPG